MEWRQVDDPDPPRKMQEGFVGILGFYSRRQGRGTEKIAQPEMPQVGEEIKGPEGVSETTDLAVRGELQDSSTTQYYYAKDMFWRFRREYRHYENTFFSTLTDGVKTATASPGMAALVATGAAFVLLRRPKRLLFKYTLGRFQSQEAMTASAQREVVELREALEVQKHEKRKLEERFRLAEEEFLRGRSKMSNAGGQIRSLVKGMYKTENNAQGLLEKLRDMSGKPAFHLRAEVASMASEAKSHRSAFDEIANHKIRV